MKRLGQIFGQAQIVPVLPANVYGSRLRRGKRRVKRLSIRRASADERVCLCTGKSAERRRQLAAATACESCRQHDHRAADLQQAFTKFIQQGSGIHVIAVYLVKNHHFTRETEEAHKAVLHIEHAEQGLIDGADRIRIEQRALRRVEPGVYRALGLRLFVVIIFRTPTALIQPGHAVREFRHHRIIADFCEKIIADALMDAVTGGACRERKVQAAVMPGLNQLICHVERRFGLAESHRRFHNIETGLGDTFDKLLLSRMRRKSEHIFKGQPFDDIHRRETALRDRVTRRQDGISVHNRRTVGGKERLIGADPVRDTSQAGQQPFIGFGSILQGAIKLLRETRDQLLPLF